MAQRFGFEKVGRFHKAEGNTVWGWAFTSTVKGEPYFDLGDGTHSDHIPADSIVPVSKAFMRASRKGLDMHKGSQVAETIYAYPVTNAIAKAVDIVSDKEGLLIGWETDDLDLIAKVESGERTGFSIGGTCTAWDIVDESGNVIESVCLDSIDKAKRFGLALKFAKNMTGKQLRRVFRLWDLEEVSLVDFPMQEPASAALAKNARKMIRKIRTLVSVRKRTLITTETDGHQHTIDTSAANENGIGSTSRAKAEGDDYGHDHDWTRADDGTIQILAQSGHTHDIDEELTEDTATESAEALPNVETIFSRRAREDLPNRKQSSSVALKEQQMADQDKDKRISELERDLAKANKRATLTDAQRAYLKTLPDTDRDGFIEKSSADRDAEIRNADSADPVEYTAKSGVFKGRTFRKSQSDMILMAKSLDEQAESLEKARQANEDAEIAKVATSKMSKLTGKPELHGKMIKALRTLEKADYEAAIEVLAAANTIADEEHAPTGTEVDLDDDNSDETPTPPTEKKSKVGSVEKARADLDAMVEKAAGDAQYAGKHPATIKNLLVKRNPKARELYNTITTARRN